MGSVSFERLHSACVAAPEALVQVLHCPKVGHVGFYGSERRLGIVFHEKLRPLSEKKALSLSDDLQNVSVSGLKPLSKLLLGLLPVIGKSGLSAERSVAFPVTHPPEFCLPSPKDRAVMFYWSTHSPSPV